MEAAVFY